MCKINIGYLTFLLIKSRDKRGLLYQGKVGELEKMYPPKDDFILYRFFTMYMKMKKESLQFTIGTI